MKGGGNILTQIDAHLLAGVLFLSRRLINPFVANVEMRNGFSFVLYFCVSINVLSAAQFLASLLMKRVAGKRGSYRHFLYLCLGPGYL